MQNDIRKNQAWAVVERISWLKTHKCIRSIQTRYVAQRRIYFKTHHRAQRATVFEIARLRSAQKRSMPDPERPAGLTALRTELVRVGSVAPSGSTSATSDL